MISIKVKVNAEELDKQAREEIQSHVESKIKLKLKQLLLDIENARDQLMKAESEYLDYKINIRVEKPITYLKHHGLKLIVDEGDSNED